MNQPSEARLRTLERRILTYLRQNPSARDTAGGIQTWWLRNEPHVTSCEIRTCLDSLVHRGWLTARLSGPTDGSRPTASATVYGLTEGHHHAIEAFLAEDAHG